MKRALMLVAITAVFSLALFANAYAGSADDQNFQGQERMMMAPFETPGSTSAPSGGFGYYGAEDHGAQVEHSQTRIQAHYGQAPAITEEAGQPYRAELVPGSTTPPSGGFGYYGAEPYTEIETPEMHMQTQYGQAPATTEEEDVPDLPFLRPGSTSPASGGLGYY